MFKGVVAGIAATTLLVGGVWAFERSQGSGDPAGTPSESSEAMEAAYFKDLPAMVHGSDLVVIGQVTDARKGRTVGTPGEDAFAFREVDLRIDRVVASADGAPTPDQVVMEEHGWDEDGTGFMINGVAWSRVGDQGIYFLHLKDEPGPARYRLAHSTGRVLETGNGLEASGSAELTDSGVVTSGREPRGVWATMDLTSTTLNDLVGKIQATEAP